MSEICKKPDEHLKKRYYGLSICEHCWHDALDKIEELETELGDRDRQINDALKLSEKWIKSTSVENVIKLQKQIKELEAFANEVFKWFAEFEPDVEWIKQKQKALEGKE